MTASRGLLAALFATTAVLTPVAVADAASPWEPADVVGRGPGGSTVDDGVAGILRTTNGVTATVSMPTPVPGSYAYPAGPSASGIAGHPEAFSLWVFIFFNPEACEGDCPDLQNNPDVVAGAFNAGGHLAGGPNLSLTGHVNHQSAVFGGPNAESLGAALYPLCSADVASLGTQT